jgi:hypothetical protein
VGSHHLSGPVLVDEFAHARHDLEGEPFENGRGIAWIEPDEGLHGELMAGHRARFVAGDELSECQGASPLV